MTAAELARLYQKRGERVPREFRKTNERLAVNAVKRSREIMTAEIYSVPEDRRKNGKPKWRRTGNLRRSERATLLDAYTVRMVNDANYAEPRHEAGKPGRRRIDPRRVSHWRDDLFGEFRIIVSTAYQLTVKAILEAR